MIDIQRLQTVNVLDTDGAEVALRSLWEHQPVVLAMVRHFG